LSLKLNTEPGDISIKWLYFLRLDLLLPSAILDGIDTAARFICDTNPNRSQSGKVAVILMLPMAIVKPFCQIFSSLKFLMDKNWEKRLLN